MITCHLLYIGIKSTIHIDLETFQLKANCNFKLCSCFLFTFRCSVLDIQLKNGGNDVWSVSISHAAEVLENWNLIGFQVQGNF